MRKILRGAEAEAAGQPKGNKYQWKKGTYAARLVRIAEVGLQKQYHWQTKAPEKSKVKIIFTFEFPGCTFEGKDKDGNAIELPAWLSYTMTDTFYNSNLADAVVALDPEEKTQDLAELLGEPALVEVGLTKTGNGKVTKVLALPNGMPIGELRNEVGYFSFTSPTADTFKQMPKWMRRVVLEAENLTPVIREIAEAVESGTADVAEDDAPF